VRSKPQIDALKQDLTARHPKDDKEKLEVADLIAAANKDYSQPQYGFKTPFDKSPLKYGVSVGEAIQLHKALTLTSALEYESSLEFVDTIRETARKSMWDNIAELRKQDPKTYRNNWLYRQVFYHYGIEHKLARDFPFYCQDTEYVKVLLKAGKVFERLKVPEDPESEARFLANYTLSPGYETMEWTWGNPPPAHTYEELPLIKESGEDEH